MSASVHIRPARGEEQAHLRSLIRAAQLDPMNVHWENFLVAEEDKRIIGIGQVKPYPGARELGSLVVVKRKRERGVGAAIINALIARESGPLFLFCLQFREPYYTKFGFRRVFMRDLPRSLKFKYTFGWTVTRLFRYQLIAMKRP